MKMKDDLSDSIYDEDFNSHSRFTWGLVMDVFKVFNEHGYVKSTAPGPLGIAVTELFQLVHTYEGKEKA